MTKISFKAFLNDAIKCSLIETYVSRIRNNIIEVIQSTKPKFVYISTSQLFSRGSYTVLEITAHIEHKRPKAVSTKLQPKPSVPSSLIQNDEFFPTIYHDNLAKRG